eukprot:9303141-Lingulodinium_polyedra.AAC.1
MGPCPGPGPRVKRGHRNGAGRAAACQRPPSRHEGRGPGRHTTRHRGSPSGPAPHHWRGRRSVPHVLALTLGGPLPTVAQGTGSQAA